MRNNNIITERSIDLLYLKQKRDEVALLMDLLFEYVSQQKDPSVLHSFMVNGLIDRFTLVSAVEMVCGEFVAVSGHMRFLLEINHKKKTVVWSYKRHHWLMWKDDRYIIDVLPYDGEFGVSVPQAVTPRSVFEKRFYRDGGEFAREMNSEEKIASDGRFSILINLLETLQQRVTF